jgi:cold shock CspA family protein
MINKDTNMDNGNGNTIRGRIKSIKKNFGFIGGIDSKDYFFHWTYLNEKTKTFNQLAVGTTVEFTPENSDGKDRARNIVAVD